jgi:phenylphosphate carboxylase alpha subunit
MMASRIKDLREYIDILHAYGEIVDISTKVDWNLELGAIIRHSYDLNAASPFFLNINDKIGRVLGAPVSISNRKYPTIKLALSMGLAPESSLNSIIHSIANAMDNKSIPPVEKPTAKFQENIMLGADIDLYKLPTPLIHQGDGGPYINTIGCIVVQSPNGKWTNWSIARIMINSKKSMTGIIAPTKHLGMIHKMWQDLGKDTPFALALGVEPSIPFVCSMALADEVNEADWLGGYWGEGIDVTPCHTNHLSVPSSAEIVIEGRISASTYVDEGPMGEYTGYSTRGPVKMPQYEVEAIQHRDNPILPVVAAGMPIEEDHTVWGTVTSAMNLYQFRKNGLPVKDCFHTWQSGMMLMALTLANGYERQYPDKKKLFDRIAEVCFNSRSGVVVPKIAVMNEDIDIYNFEEVARGIFSRTHPGCGYHIYDNEVITNLVPYLQCGEIDSRMSKKIIFDCLFDPEIEKRPIVSSFKTLWPQHIQDKVLRRWHEYGYPK